MSWQKQVTISDEFYQNTSFLNSQCSTENNSGDAAGKDSSMEEASDIAWNCGIGLAIDWDLQWQKAGAGGERAQSPNSFEVFS